MPSGALPEELVLAHRITGYLTAFVLAPFVLSAFARPGRHRPWGQVFVGVMVLLYASGLYFTFARHPLGSFVWARNLAFNFFGFFFVLLGWRAIWRMRHALWGALGVTFAFGAYIVASGGLFSSTTALGQ